MTSYSDQIAATKNAHTAVNALDSTSQSQVLALVQEWEAGNVTDQAIRYKLEALVRAAYRGSGALGSQLVANQAGIEGWSPKSSAFSGSYLNALLSDVRRNLREYKAGDRGPEAKRRLQLRVQMSASTGAQRGFTDSKLQGYKELKDFGYQLHSLWAANYVDNVPCPLCDALNGTEVDFGQDFAQSFERTKVYHSLEGPPRHPRCQCDLVVLITTLDNAFDHVDVSAPPTPAATTMTTEQVKSMPDTFFSAVVRTLKKIIARFLK